MTTRKKKQTEQPDHLRPSLVLLTKLGSLIVHADEAMSPDGRVMDHSIFHELLEDAEVQQWIKDMGPLLPVKRKP